MNERWKLLILVVVVAGCAVGQAATGLLGAVDVLPSPERPVGWRGDGTGRYPGAAPPLKWERRREGNAYATSGIVWMTPLPNIGVSMPIVVGDRVYLTSEVADLVCLEKKTGRILWIRSNAEFEGMGEAERKGNPEFAEKLAPLMASLEKVNQEVVEVLNGERATAMTTVLAAKTPALARKRELEKQINDQQLAIDKKGFTRYWGQAVFGFSGPTPTSDGKHVCVFFTTGVTACYDLEGNRKWIHRGSGGGSEHGNFASPLLCDGKVIVWANEMRAYDVETGELAWQLPAKAYNTYGSMFRVKAGGEWVAAFQWGFFARVRDGKGVWDKGVFGDTVTTPIVDGDMIYARDGYPKANDKTAGLKAWKVPANTEAGKLAMVRKYNVEWGENEIPVDKERSPFDRGYVSSPLLVDGLIYQVTQGGGLVVNEAATGEVVYRKVLPLKPRTHYWDWAGCAASPTLAGKTIYLMDNQGMTLVIEPGRAYREVGRNGVVELTGKEEQAQNVSTPVFDGGRMYYRTPGYLYCMGEK